MYASAILSSGWRKILLAIIFLLAVLKLSLLSSEAFLDNLNLIAFLHTAPSLDDLRDNWYGVGLHILYGEQVKRINPTYTSTSSVDGNSCSLWEEGALQIVPSLRQRYVTEKETGLLRTFLRVRHQQCAGRFAEALRILETAPGGDRLVAEKVRLLRRLGRDEEAFPIALRHLCPYHPEWCGGYLLNTWYPGDDDAIRRSSNGTEDDLRRTDMQTLGMLREAGHPNVVVEEVAAPLIIMGVIPHGGNYVEYARVPVTGSIVRFRVRGEVLGNNVVSCLFPRLVFWSSESYLSETLLQYQVTGKFEVDFWASLPDKTRTVTPRITFDDRCFAEGQKIVIYALNLAVGR